MHLSDDRLEGAFMVISCYNCDHRLSNVRAGETVECRNCGAWNTAPNDRGRDNAFNDGMSTPFDGVIKSANKILDRFGI
jgi:hypothetical protein